MSLSRLFFAADAVAHRHGGCLLEPPAWAYDLTFGEWADFTVKPLNPGNLWYRTAQRLAR